MSTSPLVACRMSTSPPAFLAVARPHVALASYPRSGNSLTRSLLENITGVHTGSDFCREDTVKGEAPEEGSWGKGERMHDGRVWIVKTHSRFSAGTGAFAAFTPAKAILLVRHPLSIAVSFWSFVLSDERQAQTVPASTVAQFPLIWDAFLSAVTRAWQTFHRFWLLRSARQPVLVVRYEDVASSVGTASYERAVRALHSFLYSEEQRLPRAEVESALQRAGCLLRARPEARGSYYKPRHKSAEEGPSSTAGTATRSPFFSEQQQSRVLNTLRLELCVLGYGGATGGLAPLRCSGAERSALSDDGRIVSPRQLLPLLLGGEAEGQAEGGAGGGGLGGGSSSAVSGASAERGGHARLGHNRPQSAWAQAGDGAHDSAQTLELNRGGCHAMAAGGGGPSTMRCPTHLADPAAGRRDVAASGRRASSTAAKHHDRGAAVQLSHPFQALSCVRDAARARGLNLSAWDRTI